MNAMDWPNFWKDGEIDHRFDSNVIVSRPRRHRNQLHQMMRLQLLQLLGLIYCIKRYLKIYYE